MSTIQPVPKEIIQLVPPFSGDTRTLNLFLRKCQYVYDQYKGTEEQNNYVFNVLTCRLREDAALLYSERDDIVTWPALKELLIEHFGDPRTETCIYGQLDSLKIKPDESYHDFCNRIKSVRSLYIGKLNSIEDAEMKRAKLELCNTTSLNVFLYNLPENIVHIVRLKAPKTLESALSIVLEEVNFLEQYYMRNGINYNNQSRGFGYKFNNVTQPKFYSNFPQSGQSGMQNQGQQQSSTVFRPQSTSQNQQTGLFFGSTPLHPINNKPGQLFGSQPQSSQPKSTQFGNATSVTFGSQPGVPFGSQSSSSFGTKPASLFGSQPASTGFKTPQAQKPQTQEINPSITKTQHEQQAQQKGSKLNKLTTSGSGEDDNVSYYYELSDDLHQNNYENHTNRANDLFGELTLTNNSQVDFRDSASIDKKI